MSILGGTYDALRSLPREYLGSPVFATIIPLFSFQSSYFDKEQFPVLCEGILKYYYIPVIKDRAKDLLPKDKNELIKEIEKRHFFRCGEVAQNHVICLVLFLFSELSSFRLV